MREMERSILSDRDKARGLQAADTRGGRGSLLMEQGYVAEILG
jgi:hypothetical protein